MSKPIVVLGSSNTDMIVKIDRIPKPGETVIGGEFSTAPGGKGANQAVAAARAGGEVVFIGRVGNDDLGQAAIEGYVRDGINVDHVLRDTGASSGVALIFVDKKGENSIAVASGANARVSPGDVRKAEDVIASAGMLLMQLEIPLDAVHAAAEIAFDRGAPVILNPAPAQPLDDDLLRKISILTPNESETEILTGMKVEDETGAAKAAEALRAKGVEAVIVTLGSRGAYVSSEEFTGNVPCFRVECVDTTAAGDVFNGALTVALSEGRKIRDAVRFACAAAGISVTRMGAQPSAPKREEIEAFLRERTV
ncbi:MAG: ribokinase [Candidatus Latescibacterota bacterium]